MIRQQQQPYVNTREDGAFRFLGVPSLMRSTGETTDGAFGLIEHWMIPPGFASPYHVHHQEDEAFYILEGTVAFVCDGKWLMAGPGSYVFGPREIPHGFKIVGSTPARMLLLCAPAGFEHFVMELATDISTPPGPPDVTRLVSIAAKYKVDILGPLPEQTGVETGKIKSDHEMIDIVRGAHIAALNAQDAAAYAGLFTEDAVQMPPNAPANVSRARIQPWAEAFLRTFKVELFTYQVTEIHIMGDRAFESGSYRINLTRHGNSELIEEVGKYITIFQRLPNGGWAMARDIWNSDQPLGNC